MRGGRDLGRCQLFVLKIWRCNQFEDGIAEKIGVFAIVEAEAHFLKVGLEMFCTEFMPATAQTALEQRECGFNGIGVGLSAYVFLDSMLNHLVLFGKSHSPCHSAIGVEFVGKEHVNVLSYVIAEKLLKDSPGDFLGMEQTEFPVALADTDDWTLFGAAPAMLNAEPLAADVGFIHLDLSAQFWPVRFNHRSANPVTEVPCGLVAHTNRALNLASGHALLGFTEDGDGNKPLPQRQVGIVEDGSRRHAKLVVAAVTVVLEAIGDWSGLGSAARALRAIRPAQLLQSLAALFIRAEVLC